MSDLYPATVTHGSTTKHLLPQDPLFTRLLTLAAQPALQHKPAIVDLNHTPPIRRTLAELLSDAIHLRRRILSALPTSVITTLTTQTDDVYIHLLAPGGYAFTVGILAILSLGAACSPLSLAQPANELRYYAQKTRAVAVLTAPEAVTLGQTLTESSPTGLINIPIPVVCRSTTIPLSHILLPTRGYLDPNGAALVIFTSGTTGPPKAAVLRRASLSDGALSYAAQLGLAASDTLLHVLPAHHATGVWVSFFPFLQAGATIEFRPGPFEAGWVWERWARHSGDSDNGYGPVTCFTGVPTVYMRMARWFQGQRDERVRARYTAAAARLRLMMCGTSALPRPLDQFWSGLRGGRRVVQRYGSTELGVVFNMPVDGEGAGVAVEIPDGSVGEVTLGVDVKLASSSSSTTTSNNTDEEEGEILARSFNMFTKYLHDPEATAASFDANGYFRSGDIARRQGRFYFIVGRASVDIIKSGGYKISALDVEREILALPYVAECMVVGVADEEFGQRVACVLCLRDDEVARGHLAAKDGGDGGSLSLDGLRTDVREGVAGYKLPTLLRVIKGELPKSATGKVVKKTLGPFYFPPDYARDPDVQVWNRDGSPTRPKL